MRIYSSGIYALTVSLALLISVGSAGAAHAVESPWTPRVFKASPQEVIAAADAQTAPRDAEVQVLLGETWLKIDASGLVTRRERQVVRFLTDAAARRRGTLRVGWVAAFERKPTMKARIIAGPEAVYTIAERDVMESVGSGDGSIFSDRRALTVPLPGLRAGAILETETVVVEHKPRFAVGTKRRIYFGDPAGPVSHTRVVIDMPKGAPFKHILTGVEGAFVKSSVDGHDRSTFEYGPIERWRAPEAHRPPDNTWPPRLVMTTVPNWKAAAAAYSVVVDAVLADSKAVIAPLIEGLPRSNRGRNTLVVARRLAQRIHSQLRYTGIEFGEAAFVPRSPGEIMRRTYGDCKDLATLLVGGMRALGFEAHVVLLLAGPGADVSEGLPGLDGFNHAIAVVEGRRPLWIDMTAPSVPVGELPYEDRSRHVLVASPKTKALRTTPKAKSGQNVYAEKRTYRFGAAGHAEVTEEVKLTGTLARFARARRSSEHAFERYLSAYTRSAYGAANVEVIRYPTTDTHKPLSYAARYTDIQHGGTGRDTAVVSFDDRRLFSGLPRLLFVTKDMARFDPDHHHHRRTPLQFDVPYVARIDIEVAPPTGYRAKKLPKSERIELGGGHYSQTFRWGEDGAIEGTLSFDTGKARWSVEEIKQFREAWASWRARGRDGLVRFKHQGVILREEGKGGEALALYREVLDSAPHEMMNHVQWIDAMRERGYGATARRSARKVVKQFPEATEAWSALGRAELAGDLGSPLGAGSDAKKAEAAFRKSLALDADYLLSSVGLLDLLFYGRNGAADKRFKEAVKRLEALREKRGLRFRDPQLLDGLLQLGRFKAARKLLDQMPENRETNVSRVALAAQAADVRAAVKLSANLEREPTVRAAILLDAMDWLVSQREYTKANGLLRAVQKITDHPKSRVEKATALIQRLGSGPATAKDPSTPVRALLAAILTGQTDSKTLRRVASKALIERLEPGLEKQRETLSTVLPEQAWRQGQAYTRDWIERAAPAKIEGGDYTGYRVTIGDPKHPSMVALVKKNRKGEYRVVALGSTQGLIGEQVLSALGRRKEKAAKTILDWFTPSADSISRFDPFLEDPRSLIWRRKSRVRMRKLARLTAVAFLAKGGKAERALALGMIEELVVQQVAGQAGRVAIVCSQVDALMAEGRYRDALAVLRDAKGRFERSLGLLTKEALALSHMGRTAEAARLLQRVLNGRFDWRAPMVLPMLAALTDSNGDIHAAARLAGQATEHMPHSGTFRRYAELSAHAGNAPKIAVEAAKKAVELSAGWSVAAWRALALAHAANGDGDAAMRALERATGGSHGEISPEVQLILARIAEADGQPGIAHDLLSNIKKPAEAATQRRASNPWRLAQARLSNLKVNSRDLREIDW